MVLPQVDAAGDDLPRCPRFQGAAAPNELPA